MSTKSLDNFPKREKFTGMTGYTKLFGSILASTIWREDDKTRIVWITMLAMANREGICEGSVPGLADFARVSVEDCRAALEKLMSPDPDSRSQEYEGRRICKVDGGWAILNHRKYREKMGSDERREYNRIKQAEFRSRKPQSLTVNDKPGMSALSAHTEAEAEAEAEAEEYEEAMEREAFALSSELQDGEPERMVIPPADSQAQAYGVSIGLPVTEVTKFMCFYGSKGWKVGKTPMKDWHKAMGGWKARWMETGLPATSATTSEPPWIRARRLQSQIDELTRKVQAMPDGPERVSEHKRLTAMHEELAKIQ